MTGKYDALHDLVPFVLFKKREKHPWRSVNSSKVADSNRAAHHECTRSINELKPD